MATMHTVCINKPWRAAAFHLRQTDSTLVYTGCFCTGSTFKQGQPLHAARQAATITSFLVIPARVTCFAADKTCCLEQQCREQELWGRVLQVEAVADERCAFGRNTRMDGWVHALVGVIATRGKKSVS
jgi:hypothetical protein